MAPPAAAAQAPPQTHGLQAIQVTDAHNCASGAAANSLVPTASAVAHLGLQQWLQMLQGQGSSVNIFVINMGI